MKPIGVDRCSTLAQINICRFAEAHEIAATTTIGPSTGEAGVLVTKVPQTIQIVFFHTSQLVNMFGYVDYWWYNGWWFERPLSSDSRGGINDWSSIRKSDCGWYGSPVVICVGSNPISPSINKKNEQDSLSRLVAGPMPVQLLHVVVFCLFWIIYIYVPKQRVVVYLDNDYITIFDGYTTRVVDGWQMLTDDHTTIISSEGCNYLTIILQNG